MSNDFEVINVNDTIIESQSSEMKVFEQCMSHVRDDLKDDPYIAEAIRVLPVQGYRSSIGSIWNAVIDDLRQKIMYRSLDLFNKEMELRRKINSYEDFQDYVNDDELIEGAYKIGVIGWEAKKVLRHAKETRHLFDGHPKSSNPSIVKVLGMFEDCIKYVLSQDYPTPIIDIEEYINIIGTEDFDRNEFAVENALSDLPDRYKNELINRVFTAYVHPDCSSILRSNIEFVAPILWNLLFKETKVQIVRRVDREIIQGNVVVTDKCFDFIDIVGGTKYLSASAKKYKIKPLVSELLKSLDSWNEENRIVHELERYSGYIPHEYLKDYIWGLTQTYVGYVGGSANFARTDFYADGAAMIIPKMFESFDDSSADLFLEVIKENKQLRGRLKSNSKLQRLRKLGDVIYEKLSSRYQNRHIYKSLLDEKQEREFYKLIDSL